MLDGLQRPVGPGLPQRLDVVAAGGDAGDRDAGPVAGFDVAGGVADGDAGASARVPPETSSPRRRAVLVTSVRWLNPSHSRRS